LDFNIAKDIWTKKAFDSPLKSFLMLCLCYIYAIFKHSILARQKIRPPHIPHFSRKDGAELGCPFASEARPNYCLEGQSELNRGSI